ncbi:DUF397 domain-containing protein [Streptomonospora litoralis]|uniref:DUF397 domain-containing protein n=1 Tax=Streptomonospora litoralis TaxID=2498135 RepID=A0A4P6Q3R3_9ACTN|nr:DUF397 domain-containing protein [Streptomonospora litoralis]QBI55255.1 hypothetical protein EKD16_17435 [Streptomonospora litoralis]
MNLRIGQWKKSSYSGSETNCVETARLPDQVGLRDSKSPDTTLLAFPHHEWVGFLREVAAEPVG